MKTIKIGFTMVELVVSIAIFLIVVLGAAFSISTILSTHNRDLERTQALILGREKAIEFSRKGVIIPDNTESDGERIQLSEHPLLYYSIENRFYEFPPYPVKETDYIRNILVIHYAGGRIKFDF